MVLKPKVQKVMKVNAPHIDEILELAIVKILDGTTHSTMWLKLKFTQNSAMLDIANNGLDTIILKTEVKLGILDLRSISCYKIKHGILQQNLSKYYRFEKADTLCEHFNKLINNLKKRENKKKQRKIFHG